MTLFLMGWQWFSHWRDAPIRLSAEGVKKHLLYAADIIAERGELPGQEVQRTLVDQFTCLSIHFILDHATHKFRLIHHHGIKEYQNLAQVILASCAANRPHGTGLNGHWFTG